MGNQLLVHPDPVGGLHKLRLPNDQQLAFTRAVQSQEENEEHQMEQERSLISDRAAENHAPSLGRALLMSGGQVGKVR